MDRDLIAENQKLKKEIELLTEALTKSSVALNEQIRAIDSALLVARFNLKLQYVLVNDLLCSLSGFSRSEFLSQKLGFLILHKESAKKTLKELKAHIKQLKNYRVTLELKKKDGGSFFVDSVFVPIIDKNSDAYEIMEISRDITDLVLKERELEELRLKEMQQNIFKAKELKKEELVESIPFPAVITDADGKILVSNGEFLEEFFVLKKIANLSQLFKKGSNEKLFMLGWVQKLATFESLDSVFESVTSSKRYFLKAKEILEGRLYLVVLVEISIFLESSLSFESNSLG